MQMQMFPSLQKSAPTFFFFNKKEVAIKSSHKIKIYSTAIDSNKITENEIIYHESCSTRTWIELILDGLSLNNKIHSPQVSNIQ